MVSTNPKRRWFFYNWGRRQWTDNTGRFSVEAELGEASDGNVRLKRNDGTIIAVSVSELSCADQDYLTSKAKQRTWGWVLLVGLLLAYWAVSAAVTVKMILEDHAFLPIPAG